MIGYLWTLNPYNQDLVKLYIITLSVSHKHALKSEVVAMIRPYLWWVYESMELYLHIFLASKLCKWHSELYSCCCVQWPSINKAYVWDHGCSKIICSLVQSCSSSRSSEWKWRSHPKSRTLSQRCIRTSRDVCSIFIEDPNIKLHLAWNLDYTLVKICVV